MNITPYSVACPYERFEGNSCLHLQGKKFTSRTITSYFLYLFNFKQQVGDLNSEHAVRKTLILFELKKIKSRIKQKKSGK